MNYKKVKFKVRAPGGIVESKLEVNTSSLKMWNGVDAYVNAPSVGKSILKVVDPNLGVGVYRYFKSDGTEIDTATAAQTITDMGSVHASHFHEKEEILGLYDGSTGKVGGEMAFKADKTATGDKIPWTQIPQSLKGQMRIAGITGSADTTVYTDTLFGAHLLGNDEGEALVGSYYIVGRASQTLDLRGADYEFVDGTTDNVILRAGDWIILAGRYLDVDTPKYLITYIQNAYVHAYTGVPGVVDLSTGAKKTRAALGGASDESKVIDEYALREVLKDFHQIEVQEDPISISAGDPLKTVNRVINNASHLQRSTAGTEDVTTSQLESAGITPLPIIGDIIWNYNNSRMYELTSINAPGIYVFTWIANKNALDVPAAGFDWGKMYWDTPSSSYIIREDLSGTATNTRLKKSTDMFKEGDIIFESYDWIGDADGGTSDTPAPGGGGIQFEGL